MRLKFVASVLSSTLALGACGASGLPTQSVESVSEAIKDTYRTFYLDNNSFLIAARGAQADGDLLVVPIDQCYLKNVNSTNFRLCEQQKAVQSDRYAFRPSDIDTRSSQIVGPVKNATDNDLPVWMRGFLGSADQRSASGFAVNAVCNTSADKCVSVTRGSGKIEHMSALTIPCRDEPACTRVVDELKRLASDH